MAEGPQRIRPSQLPRLTGDETFEGDQVSVLEFWQWALGDLRMNNARGYLAEFLVALATGSAEPLRVEWGSHDVTTAAGVRLEVKSSAFLQSWSQAKVSTPRFSLTGASTIWDEETGTWIEPSESRVHAWVFCLQTCKKPDGYDPLSMEQWAFWVALDEAVQALGQDSAGLNTIDDRFGPAVEWADLGERVEKTVAV